MIYEKMVNFTETLQELIVLRQNDIERDSATLNKKLEQLECKSVKIMAEKMYNSLDKEYSDYSILKSSEIGSKFQGLLSERRSIRDRIDHICTSGKSQWGIAMRPKTLYRCDGGGGDGDALMMDNMNVSCHYDSTLHDPYYRNFGNNSSVPAISWKYICPSIKKLKNYHLQDIAARNLARKDHRIYLTACLKHLPDGFDLSYQNILSTDEQKDGQHPEKISSLDCYSCPNDMKPYIDYQHYSNGLNRLNIKDLDCKYTLLKDLFEKAKKACNLFWIRKIRRLKYRIKHLILSSSKSS